jgi:hypothetical protein
MLTLYKTDNCMYVYIKKALRGSGEEGGGEYNDR